jgi:hypothetical protein
MNVTHFSPIFRKVRKDTFYHLVDKSLSTKHSKGKHALWHFVPMLYVSFVTCDRINDMCSTSLYDSTKFLGYL